MNDDFTVGSLFAGIGGIDLGLEAAGMRVLWQVENDEACQRILSLRFPRSRLYGSIHRRRDYPHVDMLCGGFPCQPISHAGKQLFEADPRWLWPQFLRVIKQVQPRWVLVENVEGLRTRGLGVVLKGLAESGYDAEWDCLPAAAFGAPHQRYRYFVVAYSNRERQWEHQRIFTDEWRRTEYGAAPYSQTSSDASLGRFTAPRVHGEPSSISHVAHASSNGAVVADLNVPRLQRLGSQRKLGSTEEEVPVNRFGAWAVEPGVVRMVYRVPSRMVRIKQLGNAVVPQVSFWIGQRILEAEARDRADKY